MKTWKKILPLLLALLMLAGCGKRFLFPRPLQTPRLPIPQRTATTRC